MAAPSIQCRYRNYLPDEEYICDPADPEACQPCKRLSELEEKVKKIRRMLVGIENERQKLKTQANQHHDRLIHRLPPEISGEIFTLCVPEDLFKKSIQTSLSLTPRHVLYSPLVISAVCKEWHAIAYSMPRLWRTLPLYYPLPQPLFVEHWIQRAGQLPLSIILRVYDDSAEENLTAAIEIIDVLEQYSSRWQELTCEGPLSLLLHFKGNTPSLPNLRTLRFENGDISMYDIDTDRQDEIQLNPTQLTSLSISAISPAAFNFDWQYLTELCTRYIDYPEFFEALQKAPNLVKVTVEQCTGLDAAAPNSIVVRHLQELENIAMDFTDVLRGLSTPSLQALTLTTGEDRAFGDEDIDISLVYNFLRASGCSLERLSLAIDGSNLSRSDITLICDGTPTLQHLSLKLRDAITEEILDYFFDCLAEFSLANGTEVPRHLPNLRSLHLDLVIFPSDWNKVLNVFNCSAVQQPRNNRYALKSVIIHLCPDEILLLRSVIQDFEKEGVLSRILWLEEAGATIKIKYGKEQIDLIGLAIRHPNGSDTTESNDDGDSVE